MATKNSIPQSMALVTNGLEELIPTQQYGNIRIGPTSVSKYVEDTPEAIQKGLDTCFQECLGNLARQRKVIMESIVAAGIK